MAFRVLIEPGSYPLHNHGDNAMMQIAIERLRGLWPDPRISVVTSRPDRLKGLCPLADPLSAHERSQWLSGRSLLSGKLNKRLPAALSNPLTTLERRIWLKCPTLSDIGIKVKARLNGRTNYSTRSFYRRLEDTDLVVVTGMGLINDSFHDLAGDLLDELQFALLRGQQVVAFGQGIGPINTPELRRRAQSVLPRLSLITVREKCYAPALLESLGVNPEKIIVTGDDAIEYAYRRRRKSLGNDIGVNLRLARYSTSDEGFLPRLRSALSIASEQLCASLVPVPISLSAESSDVRSIGNLLDGIIAPGPKPTLSQEDLLDTIAGCRIVVTGSYHAGVFALAQGIPVIALAQSLYYEQKFIGLSEQFGVGCRVIDLREQITDAELAGAIHNAWESAESVRDPLLASAYVQIQASRAAYQMLPSICSAS